VTLASRARALVAPLAVLVAGILPVSCVLLVAPATYGDRCKFDGEDTACGRCLRDRCQPAIDGCCKDGSCSATLGALEGCALRDAAACDELASRKGGAGNDLAVGMCATTLCAAVCRSFSGASDTKCSESAFGRGATCSCMTASGAGNDFECSPATYPGTVCCAPDGWPATGLECSCLPLGCHPIPEGCSCSLVDTPPEQSECTATTCCVSNVDPDECVCRPTCFDNETRVASCSVTAQKATGPVIGCKKGQKRVESCSIRAPGVDASQ
jgi:hypothetical protein